MPQTQPQTIDFDPSVDYYAALGLADAASAEEIKKAYRRLARQYHPDSTGGDKAKEARFKDVQCAYDVLGDADKKKLYDDIRRGGVYPPRGAYGWQDHGPEIFGDLSDLFGQFFSSAPRTGAGRIRVERVHYEPSEARVEHRIAASDGSWLQVDGSDVHSDVRISFDKAIVGATTTIATLDGKADVKIPPGTGSGKKLRLRGKGVVDRAGHGGDHYVTIHVDVPGDLDEEEKKLLTQLVAKLRRRDRHK